jgi:hypothetical protein
MAHCHKSSVVHDCLQTSILETNCVSTRKRAAVVTSGQASLFTPTTTIVETEGAQTLGYSLGYRAGLEATASHEVDYGIKRGARGGYESYPLPPTPSHAADERLNQVSVDHGAQLGAGLIKPADLGNLIRKDVCK